MTINGADPEVPKAVQVGNILAPPSSLRYAFRRKEKTFRTRMTAEGWLFVALIVVPAILLGLHAFTVLVEQGSGASYLVAAVDGCLLGTLGRFLASHTGKSIRVTPSTITCDEVTIRWEEIREFSHPCRSGGLFRTAAISDGRRRIHFNTLVLNDYDLLVNLVGVARKYHDPGTSRHTLPSPLRQT